MVGIVVSVRMTPAEVDRLAALAAKTDRTRSSVIRQVLTLLDRPDLMRLVLGSNDLADQTPAVVL